MTRLALKLSVQAFGLSAVVLLMDYCYSTIWSSVVDSLLLPLAPTTPI